MPDPLRYTAGERVDIGRGAVDDAKGFLDMDRTYAVPVNEATIVG